MENKLVVYSNVHKGQRMRFYKIAMQTGTLDFADQNAFSSLYSEVKSMREQIRLHVRGEEQFLHPILKERLPSEARRLEEDHRSIDQQFDDLTVNLDAIRAASVDFEKRREMMLEFYRALNRFISFYLVHINKEEELIQPALWELTTAEELLTAFKAIIHDSETTAKPLEHFEMMMMATNLYERAEILLTVKPLNEPEVFPFILEQVQQVLAPEDWAPLKTKLRIN
jgi:iron-sulfur cluster repair protein YtfE (RIC family)